MKKKVLLIGWDAADWNIINPLLQQGKMPALQGLINRGVKGNLSTMNPPYSPMLWTSVATGKTPDKHGVLGFIEIDTEQQMVRPVTVSQRKTRALWNILHHKGMKSNLVGWWPSHPAEPINGAVVSDLFPKPIAKYDEPWPLAPGCVHPKSLCNELEDLRMHPQELTGAHILPFIPRAAEIKNEDQKSLQILAKIVSHNTSLHAASTYLMENKEWDFTGVYYDMIDHFCHGFMKFYPPKLPRVSKESFEIFKDVIDGAYIFQDMMLERSLQLAGDDTLVVVMSDHGYVSDNNRMLEHLDMHAAPALEHREFGMIVMAGPGIRKNETVYGASLLDITPTLLHYMGLEVGEDMDGRVLQDVFTTPTSPKTIPSWDQIEGDFGELEKEVKGDALSEQAAMEQLIELGYVDRPDINMEKAIHETKCDLRFNLARVYLGKQEYDKCEEILRELILEESKTTTYLVDLIQVCLLKENYSEARNFLELLRQKDATKAGKTKLTEAKILLGEGNIQKAKTLLEELSERTSMTGIIALELGKLFMSLEEYEKAAEQFQKAVDFQPQNAKNQHALAKAYIQLNQPEKALDRALTSVELVRHFPDAHYTVGQALEMMGDKENALNAYRTAQLLQPKLSRAKMAVENLMGKVSQSEKASENVSEFPEVIVVSGLPRSGTSMMMQMLAAGGVVPLTDNVRKEDVSNPKGYFEYEKTKGLHKDNSWLHEAEGKVIKVVAPLLKHLPSNFRYKVVFMTRDLDEVLASQDKMLGRVGAKPQEGVRESFEKELQKLDQRIEHEPGFEVIKIAYKDVVENPKEPAKLIADFLNKELDIKAMTDQVEAKLYRNRVMKF
ncbi:MAG: alkaline phosphatase family protein [bacterium]|nr:alkaline phosphatase family protein [bacterium]